MEFEKFMRGVGGACGSAGGGGFTGAERAGSEEVNYC